MVLALFLAGCGGDTEGRLADTAPPPTSSASPTPRPTGGSGQAGTTLDPNRPSLHFELSVDGVTETLRARALNVVRTTGPDCATSETLITDLDGNTGSSLREAVVVLTVEAPLIVGVGGALGTYAPLEWTRWLLIPNGQGGGDVFHTETWRLEALGDDTMEVVLEAGKLCTDAPSIYDDPSTCPDFTEARLSLALAPDDPRFDPTPVLCTVDDKTTGGEMCQLAGPQEPCP